jgi:zinc transport system substrate-binding protein
MNFDSDKIGDSARNCLGSHLTVCGAFARQLSALSPILSLSPKFIAAAFFLASAAIARAEAPKVAASFKPVHSLAASVMQGVGEPYLIVKGAASPHDYAMTPSDAEALQSAGVIFWIGPELETFLQKPIAALGTGAQIIALEDTEGLTKLAPREGGAFEAHEEEAHAGEESDPHLWLDPLNAKLMVRRIEAALSKADPANAAAYKANADKTAAELDALETEITATLAPVKGRPFITFHDAFQYFEKRFGLQASGSITVNPDAAPGAARITVLRAKISELGVRCVFSEPNFEPKIIDAVIEGSSAKTAALDPEASALAEGPKLYLQLMRGIAKAMRECLGAEIPD